MTVFSTFLTFVCRVGWHCASARRQMDDPRTLRVRAPSGGGGRNKAQGHPPGRERGSLHQGHQVWKGNLPWTYPSTFHRHTATLKWLFVDPTIALDSNKWRAHFQNLLNPLLMKIEFLTSLYRITLELVTEWNLDLDNSRKYIFFFNLNFVFPIDTCINSVKETCFSQKYQKWI